MPTKLEVTTRTKNAVRTWSGETFILLDHKLAKLRPNYMAELRTRVNKQFAGEDNMPISTKDWSKLDPKTVREIRDEVFNRVS